MIYDLRMTKNETPQITKLVDMLVAGLDAVFEDDGFQDTKENLLVETFGMPDTEDAADQMDLHERRLDEILLLAVANRLLVDVNTARIERMDGSS